MNRDSTIAIDATADRRIECVRLDHAWGAFVRSHAVRPDVRPVIERSWLRCAELKLDAFHNRTNLALTETQVISYRESDPLFVNVKEVLGSLVASAFDSDHMLVFTDAGGNMVFLDGDRALQRRAEAMNFVVGSSWNEANAGTNAIGTAIASAAPVQVFGPEHYCESVHRWTCSAAPILDPSTGRVLGVVDLTGPREVFHPHTLAVVVTATRLIEQRLRNKLELERFHLLERYLLESSRNDGALLAVLDRGLRVVKASPALHQEGWITHDGRLAGCPVETITAGIELAWERPSVRGRSLSFECSVCLDQGQPAGLLVRAAELRRVRPARRSISSSASSSNSVSSRCALHTFDTLVGAAPAFVRAILSARKAGSDLPVLVEGETGTGKELVAQAIHSASSRKSWPFITVNCAALTGQVAEIDLLGSLRSGVTGSRGRTSSTFLNAARGTIFLDEVGDMPLNVQATLLRELEASEVHQVGAKRTSAEGARIIAATHEDLAKAVRRGTFRSDLYYRLNVIRVTIPPLRDRLDDIERLLAYFCVRESALAGCPVPQVDTSAMGLLRRYAWPGNVRELRNLVQRLVAIGSEVVSSADLPSEFLRIPPTYDPRRRLALAAEEAERGVLIRTALDFSCGNVAEAARTLGISRSTIYRYLSTAPQHSV